MIKETDEELHIEARRYTEQRKAAGAIFDKKMLRFNDIVAVGRFYGQCGDGLAAIAGVREAVDACVKGDPQYVPGRGPLTMIQPWMVPTK